MTKKFEDEETYKNDERYVKVWLQYVRVFLDSFPLFSFSQADKARDPLDIFNYMNAKRIGSVTAVSLLVS